MIGIQLPPVHNRDIEYVTQNENTTEEEAIYNGNNTDLVRSTVRGDLYDSSYTDISSSGSSGSLVQLVAEPQSNTKKLVVVATCQSGDGSLIGYI